MLIAKKKKKKEVIQHSPTFDSEAEARITVASGLWAAKLTRSYDFPAMKEKMINIPHRFRKIRLNDNISTKKSSFYTIIATNKARAWLRMLLSQQENRKQHLSCTCEELM